MGFFIEEIDKNKAKKAKEERPPRLSRAHRLADPAYRAQCLSGAPQAVVKVVSHLRFESVHNCLSYISRKGELSLETELGESVQGPEAIRAYYERWREDFEAGKKGSKRPPRHATHLILSAKCLNSDHNARLVLSAARQLLHERFGAIGYEFALIMHRDTAHPHVHVVINNYNQEHGKLRLNQPELEALRSDFAKQLARRGIEAVATRRLDRPHTIERVLSGKEGTKENKSWYRATLAKIEAAHSTPGVHSPGWLRKQMSRLDSMANASRSKDDPRKELLARLDAKRSELLQLAGKKPTKATQQRLQELGNELAALSKELAKLSRKPKEASPAAEPVQLARDPAELQEQLEQLPLEQLQQHYDQERLAAERAAAAQDLRRSLEHSQRMSQISIELERRQMLVEQNKQTSPITYKEDLDNGDNRRSAPFGVHRLRAEATNYDRRRAERRDYYDDKRDPFAPRDAAPVHNLRQVPSRNMANAKKRDAQSILPVAPSVHRGRIGDVRRGDGGRDHAAAIGTQSRYYSTLQKVESLHSTPGLHRDKWLINLMGKLDAMSSQVRGELKQSAQEKLKMLRKDVLGLANAKPGKDARDRLKLLGQSLENLAKELSQKGHDAKEDAPPSYKQRLEERRRREQFAENLVAGINRDFREAKEYLKESAISPAELQSKLLDLGRFKDKIDRSVSKVKDIDRSK